MSSITKDQISVKRSDEETLSWSRVIRFEWTSPGSDQSQLVVIKLYHSDFDGYEIDWFASDYPQSFRDLVDSENDLAELLDGLTWNFTNE
jgi:hypothetical protein